MGLLSQGSDQPLSVIIVGIGNTNFLKVIILKIVISKQNNLFTFVDGNFGWRFRII